MDHPCKETCSGWKQGFEKGYAYAQEEVEPLISEIHKRDLEYLTNKIAAEKAKNAELVKEIGHYHEALSQAEHREVELKAKNAELIAAVKEHLDLWPPFFETEEKLMAILAKHTEKP